MTSSLFSWRRPRELIQALGHVLTALPVAWITGTIIAVLAMTAVGLVPVLPVAVPFAVALFFLARAFGRLERHRIHSLLGVRLADPVPALQAPRWWGRLWERVRSGPRWKEIGYHVSRLFVDSIGGALTIVAWCGSLGLLLLPLYVAWLPGETAHFGLFDVALGGQAFGLALIGLIGLVALAPLVTTLVSRVELRLAQALIGPSELETHRREVERLETSRSAAVDSAEAERRRIERDLHDGAQQRLVALAANLGAAREKLAEDTDPAGGRRLVDEAHEEAKAALREIRDLVRGIHPVILEDRGLDAALSAVVARAPIPVALDVDVAERPPAAVESAAYFVVSEALTNVVRHAAATRAHVSIARAGNRLVIEVRDDGRGGADPERGTGLRGLRDRVAGMGGTMYVISPAGGPTTVSVELPCAS